MAFDLALDLSTGDLLFGPTHDLMGITGPELATQRMVIRAKIPRGSFIYDADGTLGSFLHLITRNPSSSQLVDARSALSEALSDMEGVEITSIDLEIGEQNNLIAHVKFQQTGGIFQDSTEETGFVDSSEPIEFDARFPVTQD